MWTERLTIVRTKGHYTRFRLEDGNEIVPGDPEKRTPTTRWRKEVNTKRMERQKLLACRMQETAVFIHPHVWMDK